MKLQRWEVGDDYEMPGDYGDHGASCKSTDVERLEAENAALHAECDRLTEMLTPQKPMSADEVTEPGWYWHTRKGWGGDWFIHKVVRYGVLDELHTLGNCFSYDRLDGQFVGPLKAPEV